MKRSVLSQTWGILAGDAFKDLPSLSLSAPRNMDVLLWKKSECFSGVKNGFGGSKSEGMKPEQQPVSGCPSLRVIIVRPNHSSCLSLLRFYPLITSAPPGGPSLTHSGWFSFFYSQTPPFSHLYVLPVCLFQVFPVLTSSPLTPTTKRLMLRCNPNPSLPPYSDRYPLIPRGSCTYFGRSHPSGRVL